jgi:nucleoside-diphosphate-sugar epimerase
MNYLIFGSSGFIGGHLFDYINTQENENPNIFNFDIVNSEITFVESIYTDVRKSIDYEIDNKYESIIYNLAAIHVTPGHLDSEYFETNVLGATNICNFARLNNINTIVFTSSISVYGTSEEIKTEESLPLPNTAYGISKLNAEYIHKIWQAEDPINRKLIIVRPGVVFGKNEKGNFTRLFKSLKKGFFFYPGRKDTLKAAIYVKDLVRILYSTSMNEKSGVLILNLSYFPPPSIELICNSMCKVIGAKFPNLVLPSFFLKFTAGLIYQLAKIFGKKLNGINPDRVKKLMISTNVSGEKLAKSDYAIKFSLDEGLRDWYKDGNEKGLF